MDELDRAKTGRRRQCLVRRLENVGGFSGKATLLAAGQVYHNDPGAWRKELTATEAATPRNVLDAARRWIAKGDYTLTVSPLAKGAKAPTDDVAETSGLGDAPDAPKPVLHGHARLRTPSPAMSIAARACRRWRVFYDLVFPALQHAKLKNGIEVVLAQRQSVPVTHVELMFDSGYAADQGRKLGTSSFTMGMLDEGSKNLDSVQIAERKQHLGAIIAAGCGLDSCSASLNALDDQLKPSLQLFADVVLNPAFRDADIARIRGQWLAGIAQEKAQPTGMALRTLPPLLYGKDHAYAIPFTGSGTEASIASLTDADMRDFMRDYVRPDNVKILVAGDITLEQILPQLDAVFGEWKAPASKLPTKNIGKVAYPDKVRVYLMDRPAALQSLILAGLVAPSTKADNTLEIATMTGAFGGSFTSRLNMNLREDKHWAYGAGSFSQNAIGQRPYILYAPVQTDKTAPSIEEMVKEAKGVIGPKSLTREEIQKVKDGDVRAMPGQYQTNAAVLPPPPPPPGGGAASCCTTARTITCRR